MTPLPTWPAVCVYTAEDGQSRLIDLSVPVTHRIEMPDDSSAWTGVSAATQWGIARNGSSDRHQQWHTSTYAGLSVTLQGSWEIEAGNGERRLLAAGDLLIMLDTTGQGHRAWPHGDAEAVVIGIGLSEDAERDMRRQLSTQLGTEGPAA